MLHPARTRHLGAVLFTLATLGTILYYQQGPLAGPGSQTVLAEQPGQLKWYRGNLHTHTMWSDGDDFPEMVAAWYKDHGYHFLAYTDHNTLHNKEKWIDLSKYKSGKEAYDKLKARFPNDWIVERETDGKKEIRLKLFEEVAPRFNMPGAFLLIQGEEVSDKFGALPVHMNATNIQTVQMPQGGDSVYEVIQRNTDALHAQRQKTQQPMFIHLNHPNFRWGVQAEDLMRVRGENFFEVYNGHPGVENEGTKQRASTERIWDIINAHRLTQLELPVLWGLGTDDGHSYHGIPSRASNPGRGWVMVLAESLTPASLIAAMEQGRFYASSGVSLKQVISSPQLLEVEVDTQPDVTYKIEFIGTKKGFETKSEPVLDENGKPLVTTRKYSADIGKVLKTVDGSRARYDIAADDIYVRARVTSSKLHPNPSKLGEFERAWTQPALGPAAKPAR